MRRHTHTSTHRAQVGYTHSIRTLAHSLLLQRACPSCDGRGATLLKNGKELEGGHQQRQQEQRQRGSEVAGGERNNGGRASSGTSEKLARSLASLASKLQAYEKVWVLMRKEGICHILYAWCCGNVNLCMRASAAVCFISSCVRAWRFTGSAGVSAQTLLLVCLHVHVCHRSWQIWARLRSQRTP